MIDGWKRGPRWTKRLFSFSTDSWRLTEKIKKEKVSYFSLSANNQNPHNTFPNTQCLEKFKKCLNI